MTCENSTFHEEGTCELIKLDTKICNEKTIACKRNTILNISISICKGSIAFCTKAYITCLYCRNDDTCEVGKSPKSEVFHKKENENKVMVKRKKMVLKL